MWGGLELFRRAQGAGSIGCSVGRLGVTPSPEDVPVRRRLTQGSANPRAQSYADLADSTDLMNLVIGDLARLTLLDERHPSMKQVLCTHGPDPAPPGLPGHSGGLAASRTG